MSTATKSISEEVSGIASISRISTELMRKVVVDMRANTELASSAAVAMSEIESSARLVVGVVDQIGQQVNVGHASSKQIVAQVDAIDGLISHADAAANHTRNYADAIRDMSRRMAGIVNRFGIGEAQFAVSSEVGGASLV